MKDPALGDSIEEEDLDDIYKPLPTLLELYPSLFEEIELDIKPFETKCSLP